jgi:hypothetical protein
MLPCRGPIAWSREVGDNVPGKLVARFDSLEDLARALESGRIPASVRGYAVRLHPAMLPPGYVSDTWLDGLQERHRLLWDDGGDVADGVQVFER